MSLLYGHSNGSSHLHLSLPVSNDCCCAWRSLQQPPLCQQRSRSHGLQVISDLLKPERQNLTIREDRKRGVYVEGLSEWVVRTPGEVRSCHTMSS